MTLDHPGLVPLSSPVNLRDLGGIPIASGTVCSGFAVRADDLSTVTEADADDLVTRGLTTVIDLRSDAELGLTGRGPLADHPIDHHHLPLMADIGAATRAAGFSTSRAQFGEMYAAMLEESATALVTALGVIAHAPGTTAFHCAAGADRTGVLAATLLLTLGASDDAIVADYAITGTNIDAVHARLAPVLGTLFARMGVEIPAERVESTVEPWEPVMVSMLSLLRERHGDALTPLFRAGLDDTTIGALRDRAVSS